MRKYSNAKNFLAQRRIQKKSEKHSIKPKIQKKKEVQINLDKHDEKTRLYNIENNTNKLLDEFRGMKDILALFY